MRKTYLIFTLVIGFCFTSIGQNINSYKYVSVPEKFDFLKESNQYQMNDLSKFLFEKYGFTVFMDGGLKPLDLSLSPCNVLQATIVDDSGLFETKLQVVLKNCENQEVFVSKVGSSREKEYKTAYQQALRDAFSSFETVNYSYDQNSRIEDTRDNRKKEANKNSQNDNDQNKPEVIVTAIPQVSEKAPIKKNLTVANRDEKVYVSGNVEIYALKTGFGYQLFLKDLEEPFAKLIQTESSNHYIYSTIQGFGVAYFDEDGNLNVEVLASDENSTSLKIYKLKN